MGTLTINLVDAPDPVALPWNGAAYVPEAYSNNTSVKRKFVGWADPNLEGYRPQTGDIWARKGKGTALAPRVILDSDFWTDVGDAQVVKAALTYHSEGMINLMGVGISDAGDKAPGCVSKMMTYYGVTDVPVCSIYNDLPSFVLGAGGDELIELYSNTSYPGSLGLASAYPGIVAGYKSWLATAPDNSVTFVTAGHVRGLMLLLQDTAGRALFNAKVQRVMCMGGMYVSLTGVSGETAGTFGGVGVDNASFTTPHAEFNISSDGSAWIYLLANCTKPIVFAGYEVGAVTGIGEPYIGNRVGTTDILRHLLANTGLGVGNARPSWDLWALMWAAEGSAGLYGITEVKGTNAIDNFAQNRFTPSPNGLHSFLSVDLTNQSTSIRLQILFNSLTAAKCQKGTVVWNGTAWA